MSLGFQDDLRGVSVQLKRFEAGAAEVVLVDDALPIENSAASNLRDQVVVSLTRATALLVRQMMTPSSSMEPTPFISQSDFRRNIDLVFSVRNCVNNRFPFFPSLINILVSPLPRPPRSNLELLKHSVFGAGAQFERRPIKTQFFSLRQRHFQSSNHGSLFSLLRPIKAHCISVS